MKPRRDRYTDRYIRCTHFWRWIQPARLQTLLNRAPTKPRMTVLSFLRCFRAYLHISESFPATVNCKQVNSLSKQQVIPYSTVLTLTSIPYFTKFKIHKLCPELRRCSKYLYNNHATLDGSRTRVDTQEYAQKTNTQPYGPCIRDTTIKVVQYRVKSRGGQTRQHRNCAGGDPQDARTRMLHVSKSNVEDS